MVVPRQGRRERSYLEGTGATEDAACGRAARSGGTVVALSIPPNYSRGRFTPRSERATITAKAATAIPATSHGRRLRPSDSRATFAQSTTTPAPAPAATTITGASTAARESEISKIHTTANTRPAVTKPEAIAAWCSPDAV